jgi:hypothetical protein
MNDAFLFDTFSENTYILHVHIYCGVVFVVGFL